MFRIQELDDAKFEVFCKDILEFETGTKFRTYRKGKDSGIDIRCIINDLNWIGQSKFYTYSNISTLKSTLKKERKKLDLLKPIRYFLLISMEITPHDEDEIIKIMSPYLKKEDLYTISEIDSIFYNNDEFSKTLYNRYPETIMPSLSVASKFLFPDIAKKMEVEFDNIEKIYKKNNINNSIKEYVFNKILNNDKEIQFSNKVDSFFCAVCDWCLCMNKFPVNQISSFIIELGSNAIFNKRWEIIEYFFKGQIEKCLQEIEQILVKFDDKNKNWEYIDLLIDKRYIESILNNKEHNLKYNTAFKELQETEIEIYNPIIDRKYKEIYEFINKSIIKKSNKSINSYEIFDSTFHQVCEKIQEIAYDIIFTGSIAHLVVFRKNVAHILYLLSTYYENDEMLYSLYVQNTIVSGYISDFKKIFIKNSNCLNNLVENTWDKIQKSVLVYDKENVEIVFSQYMFKKSNKELKKIIQKKIIGYYKDFIVEANYIKQELILNYISNNIDEINIEKFINLISNTVSKYHNKKINELVCNIFRNFKYKKSLKNYIYEFNIILEYAKMNKIQDVYLFLNLKKVLNEKYENYDNDILIILEEDLKVIYKDCIGYDVNFLDYLKCGLDILEKKETFLGNFYLTNLVYGINKLNKDEDKIYVINKYCEIMRNILQKNNIELDTKINLIRKFFKIIISFKTLDFNFREVFKWIDENKDAISKYETDFFCCEEYFEILNLYLIVIAYIVDENKNSNKLSFQFIRIYNKEKVLMSEVLEVLINVIKLDIKLDLKLIILNIINNINNTELQDLIIYICAISYNRYKTFYKELFDNISINITDNTQKMLLRFNKYKLCKILRKRLNI